MPTVGSELYTLEDGRHYIDIDGLRIKVPWRYGKIHGVSSLGLKTLYELKKGDVIKSYEVSKKIWNGSVHYVLKSIHAD